MFSLDEKGGKVKSEAGMDVKYDTATIKKHRNFYVRFIQFRRISCKA